jgi:hypothetical protein
LSDDVISDVLSTASDVAGFIGLSALQRDLKMMANAAPDVEKAYAFFSSDRGKHVLKELTDFLSVLQSPDGQEGIQHVKSIIAAFNKM